jgi:plastocyanin
MSGSASPSPAEPRNTIIIKAYKYSGATSVKAGSTVIVRNDDSVAHTVTADKRGAWDVMVPGGASRTFTAPTSGIYPYHCLYHGNMHGTLSVR